MFPTKGLEEVLVFVSFFLDFCSGVNTCDARTKCFIMKMNWMLCCCFGVSLPICSVLNSAELMGLLRQLAEIEALRICCRGLQSARAAKEEICNTAEPVEVSKVVVSIKLL